MKNKELKSTSENRENTSSKDITRKDALKKAGKYAAFTAATLFTVLSPKESQAQSPNSAPKAPRPWS